MTSSSSLKMYFKNPIGTVSDHEMNEKIEELGAQAHELSEKPAVSIYACMTSSSLAKAPHLSANFTYA